MNNLRIENAKCSDAESIVQIHHAAVHRTAAGYYSETILDNWSKPLTQNRIDRIAAAVSHAEKIVLVARDDSAVVGFGIVDLDKNYLGAIYVTPFMGRKQVGSALLARLDSGAKRVLALGALHGEPPDTALWPEKGGLDLARRRIDEGLKLFAKGDYWGYNQHCVQAKSDGRDVGQVLRYLLGPSQGTILDLVAEDTTTDYQQPTPTWVAGALIQLKPS